MHDAARALHDLGPRWVLVKGGHLADGDAVDVLFDGTRLREFPAARVATTHTHGSGDTLAAAITAGLARGLDLPEAVAFGKRFVTAAVTHGFALGAGLGPVGHFWRIRDVTEI
jgi:hydroxymethylpyrimidine/phosphomethylpyrimidine kinase